MMVLFWKKELSESRVWVLLDESVVMYVGRVNWGVFGQFQELSLKLWNTCKIACPSTLLLSVRRARRFMLAEKSVQMVSAISGSIASFKRRMTWSDHVYVT